MALKMGEILGNMFVCMVLSMRGVLKKHLSTMVWLRGWVGQICEWIRYILSHSKLHKPFWSETMRTAVDLMNLSPSVFFWDDDVPERVWTD